MARKTASVFLFKALGGSAKSREWVCKRSPYVEVSRGQGRGGGGEGGGVQTDTLRRQWYDVPTCVSIWSGVKGILRLGVFVYGKCVRSEIIRHFVSLNSRAYACG